MSVKYESMRRELFAMLAEFGTPELELQWLSAAPGEPWNQFNEWWEIIGDLLPEGARASVGFVIADEAEAEIVDGFLDLYEAIYCDLGLPIAFERYSSDPRWSELVLAARASARAMQGRSPELTPE